MPGVTEIETVEQFQDIIENCPKTSFVALNFHAPWAEPCRQMNEVFRIIATSRTDDQILFLSIDVEDELHDISEEYEVATIPHFVLLGGGGEVLSHVKGTDPKELGAAIANLVSVGEGSLPPQQTTTTPPVTTNGQASGLETEEIEEDINTRLEKLVKAAPVMLFMKGTPAAPQCGFSRQLVALLREKGVRYGFFNILADEEVRQGLKAFSDWPTYPQLYLDGNLVGGLDIVKEEFENDPDFMNEKTVHAVDVTK